MSEELHIDDVGTVLIVTLEDDDVAVDVSSASTIQFIFRKPSGTVVTKTGSLNTTGTDGKVKYTTEADFLDVHGTWKYQVKVVIGDGTWYSDWGTMMVYKNLA